MYESITKKIAIILSIVLIFLSFWMIYKQLKDNYSRLDPVLQQLEKDFTEFFNQDKYWLYPLESLNKRNVMNDINLYRGNKSYTINKEKVYICLKDKDGEYYTKNMLSYVLGHELSHVLCDEIGHTEKFHQIFEALLIEMVDYGLYDPSIAIERDYCKDGDQEV